MQLPVYNINGEMVKQIDIDDSVFGIEPNAAVIHQALVRQLANARHGNACTKTRAEVAGSKQKMFRQKHTGHARAGSIRSPIRRGGGVAFGPKPRNYRQSMPKKMRRLALRCVLSAKAKGTEIMILDELKLEEPRTKDIVGIIHALGVEASTLIATSETSQNVVKSARNLPNVKTIPARLLNVVDLTSHKILLMTEEALRQIERLWGKEAA
jgi:large subunit ribosomal protein L4